MTALEATENVPSWETVTEKLLQEENKQGVKKEEQALVSSNSQNNVYKKKIVCHYCQKPGHYKKNCYSYIRKMKQKRNSHNTGNVNCAVNNVTAKENVTLFASAYSTSSTIENSSSWIIDSGATQHMCNTSSSFSELTSLSNNLNIKVGNGECLQAVASGKVQINLLSANGMTNCTLEDVLYVPKLAHNLISISRIACSGKLTEFDIEGCKITDQNKVVATGDKVNNLYILNASSNSDEYANYCNVKTNSESLWHRRFCHLGIDNLRQLINNKLVVGADCKTSNDSFFL